MTAQEDYQAFLDAQKVPGYSLGDIEGSVDADMLKYTELKIATEQEKEVIKAFDEAKAIAFEAMRDEQSVLNAEHEALWTAKKEAGYDVDFVPQ